MDERGWNLTPYKGYERIVQLHKTFKNLVFEYIYIEVPCNKFEIQRIKNFPHYFKERDEINHFFLVNSELLLNTCTK